jgi:dsRNA-specific ribonuclease
LRDQTAPQLDQFKALCSLAAECRQKLLLSTIPINGVSSKFHKIIDILAKVKDVSDFCGIILVENDATASALFSIITNMAEYAAKLKCGLLKSSGSFQKAAIDERKRKRVIQYFEKRKLNLLIITEQVTQSVNLKPCALIVHYDFVSLPQRSFSSPQSCSQRVILLEKGNHSQLQQLALFKSQTTDRLLLPSTNDSDLQPKWSRKSSIVNVAVAPELKSFIRSHLGVPNFNPLDLQDSSASFDEHQSIVETKQQTWYIDNTKAAQKEVDVVLNTKPSKLRVKRSPGKSLISTDSHDVNDQHSVDPMLSDRIKKQEINIDQFYISPCFRGFSRDELSTEKDVRCYLTVFSFQGDGINSIEEIQDVLIITRSPMELIPSFYLYPFDSHSYLVSTTALGEANIQASSLLAQVDWNVRFYSQLTDMTNTMRFFSFIFAVLPRTLDKSDYCSKSISSGVPYQKCNMYSFSKSSIPTLKNQVIITKKSEFTARIVHFEREDTQSNDLFLRNRVLQLPCETSLNTAKELLKVQFVRPLFDAIGPHPAQQNLGKLELIHPDECELLQITSSEFQSATLVPSIMSYLRPCLSALELKRKLNLRVDLPYLCEALLLPTTNRNWNYDRLETLGDSVIEVAASTFFCSQGGNKSETSSKKQTTVCNEVLFRRALTVELPSFMNCTNLVPKEAFYHAFQNIFHPVIIQTKAIADCVESVIGASFVSNGFDAAFDTFVALGTQLGDVTSFKEFRGLIRHPECDDDIKVDTSMFNYEFQRPHYLELANPTLQTGGRFRLMGKALVQLFIIRQYFFKYDHLGPGQFSNLRTVLISLEVLGYLSAKHRLYRFFHSDCSRWIQLQKRLDGLKEEGPFWYPFCPPKFFMFVSQCFFSTFF